MKAWWYGENWSVSDMILTFTARNSFRTVSCYACMLTIRFEVVLERFMWSEEYERIAIYLIQSDLLIADPQFFLRRHFWLRCWNSSNSLFLLFSIGIKIYVVMMKTDLRWVYLIIEWIIIRVANSLFIKVMFPVGTFLILEVRHAMDSICHEFRTQFELCQVL